MATQQAGIIVDATKAIKKIGQLQAGLLPKDILDAVGQRILRDTGKIWKVPGQHLVVGRGSR